VDVVVVRSASARATGTGAALVRRYGPAVVLVPQQTAATEVPGAVAVTEPTEVRIGSLALRCAPAESGLRVEVGAASARGPPV
jgi:hypothetical protein